MDLALREKYSIKFYMKLIERQLGRSRCRRVDNIKMDLTEMMRIGLVWLRKGTSGGLS
jgi:hypothetical protein